MTSNMMITSTTEGSRDGMKRNQTKQDRKLFEGWIDFHSISSWFNSKFPYGVFSSSPVAVNEQRTDAFVFDIKIPITP